MNAALVTQLRIMKLVDMKPNFSELARLYDVDRRTVKKYYDGYEGKPKNRDKSSKLDKHYSLIKEKLAIKGTSIRAVYEFIKTEKDSDIECYSNFHRYVIQHNLLPKQSSKGHPRFETPPGKQAQVDWKENMHIANKYGELFTFQLFDYKLGHSRYCHFIYKTTKTRQDVFDCLIECFQATGGVPPLLLFQKEKDYLQPLPNRKVMESYMRHDRQTTVQKDSLVIFNGSLYSVPSAYIGKTVSLKQVENKLYIYYMNVNEKKKGILETVCRRNQIVFSRRRIGK